MFAGIISPERIARNREGLEGFLLFGGRGAMVSFWKIKCNEKRAGCNTGTGNLRVAMGTTRFNYRWKVGVAKEEEESWSFWFTEGVAG